jgi:hypothetical protein
MESPIAGVTLARKAAQRALAVSPNVTPVLAQPYDMQVTEGTEAEQYVAATDEDGQSLQFFKIEGPDFLSVATTSPGTGQAACRIRLRPGFIDAGTARGTVGVSDGIDGALRTFAATVTDAVRVPSSAYAYLDSSAFSVSDDPGRTRMADLNGDGIRDLVIVHVNTGVVSVYLGEGGAVFHLKGEFSPGQFVYSLSIGDFTGDSRPDLAIAIGGVRLMEGLGDGTFGAVRLFYAGTTPWTSAAGDLNGDGVADLVVGNFMAGTVSVLLADGVGGLRAPVACNAGSLPVDVELHDLDLDGRLDIAVADYGGGVSILLGDGNGSFAEAQHYPSARLPLGLAVGDLNGDHLPDIVTAANGSDSVSVLTGTGVGTFEPAPGFHPGHGGTALAIRDFNADGRADLAMSFIGGILIFPGDGTAGFGQGIVTAAGIGGDLGVAIDGSAIDLNEDGAADLVLPDRLTDRITVLLSDPHAGAALAARAFLSKPGPIQIGGEGPPYICVSVEPLAGVYENSDVNLSRFVMISAGTGDIGYIHADPGQVRIVEDTDRNGVAEIRVCFSRDDVRRLFSGLRGWTVVPVTIEGALNTRRCLRASLELPLKSRETRDASISPNPSNPTATLMFETGIAGAVCVRLFDLRGRLIRTLLKEPHLGAGVHSLPVDGLNGEGGQLPSGVFFYRIESPQGVEEGRFVVLK